MSESLQPLFDASEVLVQNVEAGAVILILVAMKYKQYCEVSVESRPAGNSGPAYRLFVPFKSDLPCSGESTARKIL